MYSNMGYKIKSIAKTIGITGMVFSIIGGFMLLVILGNLIGGFGVFIGFFVMIGGSVSSWLSTWLLYSWGDIVDNVEQIKETLSTQSIKSMPQRSYLLKSAQATNKSSSKLLKSAHATNNVYNSRWTCEKCGQSNLSNANRCIGCYAEKSI